MVCKEDVLSWFRDLESYRRIDVMYELLNMCVPFEIRFLGTCIEEMGRHSYQELRGAAIAANDLDRLAKDAGLTRGLLDEHARHRALLYLSLLSARNCKCASWLYTNVFRTDRLEECVVRGAVREEGAQSELMLLFTMGLHHPAFTFEQKMFFGKMLTMMFECRDSRAQPTKGTVFYSSHPPGIGVFPGQKIGNIPEVPVKVALPMPVVDNTTVMHHGHPPGLSAPPMPTSSIELLTTLWNRPGFAGTVCGAPEVPPFPPPPISPLVSQSGSPIQSRSASPHRTSRPAPPPHLPPPPVQSIDTLPVDPLPLVGRTIFGSDAKLSDEDLPDDKLPWTIPLMLDGPEMGGIRKICDGPLKPINGLRFPTYPKPSFLIDQMQALGLDETNSSSAGSSPAETPTTPHGPGRGDPKQQPRMNGVPPPPFQQQPPMCDATPPPPPLPPPMAANCSTVPYSYPTHVPLPNRSLFQFAQQAYRAPFTATPAHPYPYQQPADNTTVYSSFTVPYHLSYMYSSTSQPQQQQQQAPPRTINCYNCGASGHGGGECSGQTIEDIIQKKTYQLEYASPPLPDVDK